MCQHPSQDMKPRGNKASKWWTCNLCQSRWTRRTADAQDEQAALNLPLTPEDLVAFGRFSARQYGDVMMNEEDYCQWVLATADTEPDSCPQLHRFAQFLREAEGQPMQVSLAGQMSSDGEWSSP